MNQWTFGKKIAAGFALAFVLLLAIGVVAYRSIHTLTETSYSVARTHTILEHINLFLSAEKDAETGQRGFVITGDDAFLEPYRNAGAEIDRTMRELRDLVASDPTQLDRLRRAQPVIEAKAAELARTIELRKAGKIDETLAIVKSGEGKRYFDELRAIFGEMEHEERDLLTKRAADVEAAQHESMLVISLGTILALLFVAATGYAITRSLSLQLGGAAQKVDTSTTELRTSAHQQALGAKEQATAMNEITTTISELLATSRQIAQSAQQVAQIAAETASGARSGSSTVERATDAMASIRRQVDLIVGHMLDLGKRSQQIGAVLDIVAELAEQTNILAINATIEAAGAGEAGRRFAVVADEIRKLADRVGGSTKEIRVLIEHVRGAVNTTVMATEGGSKTVDLAAKQFADVAVSFKQIGGLVDTTTEAAREIELSTKQQASAVEQVNLAIANVAQATKETETSAGQTLEASSQLGRLAQELLRIVVAQANG